MKYMRILLFAISCFALLLTASLAGGMLQEPPVSAAAGGDQGKDGEDALPTVGSYDNLKRLLKVVERANIVYKTFAVAQETAADSAGAMRTGRDFSQTNVQVQGVDEADRVKTDGTYLYQVNGQNVQIVQAYPADQMKVVSTLSFDEKTLVPQELYVDERHLVVIGSVYGFHAYPDAREILPRRYPPGASQDAVKAIVYDITDKAHVKKLREISVEGYYVSSRKIGSALYLVTNRYADLYRIMNEKSELPGPAYHDSAWGEQANWKTLPYGEIRYFPDFSEPNYLMVAGIDLDNPGQPVDVSAYLGAGEHIYASHDHLYVAVTGYKEPEVRPLVIGDTVLLPGKPADTHTRVYKFRMDGGKLDYLARGEVPGTILNQFSMDEHDGRFRIATTRGEIWRTDEYTSKNNLYVLDQELKLLGKLEDIAPGERIYSVRFMGDRAYMVTFKKVDPLFVIDLKEPKQPKILGALKIPGYSDYLHPYDEHHVIGFGKDAVEGKWPGSANSDDTVAFYQGMKVALFDVTDVTRPKEKFKVNIGDRGTESELLHNHKALLFSREKNLLAFPVTVREVKKKEAAGDVTAYGEFTFQGAYVYRLDLTDGFTLKGKITHLGNDDLAKAGDGWYDSPKNVERILYIDDTLYALSRAKITAHTWPDMKQINALQLAQ